MFYSREERFQTNNCNENLKEYDILDKKLGKSSFDININKAFRLHNK